MSYVRLKVDGKYYNVGLMELSNVEINNGVINFDKSSFKVDKFAYPIKYYLPPLTAESSIYLVNKDGTETYLKMNIVSTNYLMTKGTAAFNSNTFSYYKFNLVGVQSEFENITVVSHTRSNWNMFSFIPYYHGKTYMKTAFINYNPETQSSQLLQSVRDASSYADNWNTWVRITANDGNIYVGTIYPYMMLLNDYAYQTTNTVGDVIKNWGLSTTSYTRRYLVNPKIKDFNTGYGAGVWVYKENYKPISLHYLESDLNKQLICKPQCSICTDTAYGRNMMYNENPDELPDVTPDPDEPDPEGPEGGDGDKDNESDDIPFPTPDISNITKLVSIYSLDEDMTQELGKELWTKDFTDNILGLNTNPLDAIISLSAYDIPIESGSNEILKIGNVEMNISPIKISNPFVTLQCGGVRINEFYGSYLDYQESIYIYLPHIGTKKLDTHVVMNSKIELQYVIDLLSGQGVAQILVKKDGLNSVIYTFQGDFAYRIPLSGRDYSTYNLGWVTGVAEMNPMKIISTMHESNKILSTEGSGSNISFANVKQPYIIRTRKVTFNNNWYQNNSYRWEGSSLLGNLEGETKLDCEIELDIPHITDMEKEEIINLLRSGIIL